MHILNSWEPTGQHSRAEHNRSGVAQTRVPFVLRYHPLFRYAFSRAIRLVPPPAELELSLFAGWSNALPSLHGITQKSALNNLIGESGSREGSCFLFPNLVTNTLRV